VRVWVVGGNGWRWWCGCGCGKASRLSGVGFQRRNSIVSKEVLFLSKSIFGNASVMPSKKDVRAVQFPPTNDDTRHPVLEFLNAVLNTEEDTQRLLTVTRTRRRVKQGVNS
jgi:hypothetical protein